VVVAEKSFARRSRARRPTRSSPPIPSSSRKTSDKRLPTPPGSPARMRWPPDHMRFLVDMNLAIDVAVWLRAQGHDGVHLRELELQELRDEAVLAKAVAENRVVLDVRPRLRRHRRRGGWGTRGGDPAPAALGADSTTSRLAPRCPGVDCRGLGDWRNHYRRRAAPSRPWWPDQEPGALGCEFAACRLVAGKKWRPNFVDLRTDGLPRSCRGLFGILGATRRGSANIACFPISCYIADVTHSSRTSNPRHDPGRPAAWMLVGGGGAPGRAAQDRRRPRKPNEPEKCVQIKAVARGRAIAPSASGPHGKLRRAGMAGSGSAGGGPLTTR
jgi:hypothetical protein